MQSVFCFCRCREKQRKEASRLQAVNRKLTAMNKLLMEENDRLQKQVSQLVYENGYFRQHTQNVNYALFHHSMVAGKIIGKEQKTWNIKIACSNMIITLQDCIFFSFLEFVSNQKLIITIVVIISVLCVNCDCGLFILQTTLATKDTSCESVVTSGQHHLTPQHPPRDASPAGLVGIQLLGPFLPLCFVVTHCSLCQWLMNSCLYFFQAFVHCRRDFSRVSFKGHWNCRGVGPNAWNEGISFQNFFFPSNNYLTQ